MNIFERLGNGWDIALTSLSVLQDNKYLMVFPLLSCVALLVVLLSFVGSFWLMFEGAPQVSTDNPVFYLVSFLFYLVNYLIIIFFNVALIHCAAKTLAGKPTSVAQGIKVARVRFRQIFAWALVSASVGAALQALQKTGRGGEIVAAIIGVTWSVTTFFIIPIIIYENRSVVDAIKESGRTMRRTWGESLGAQFSFGILYLIGLIPIVLVAWLAFRVNPLFGTVLLLSMVGILVAIASTANAVFVAATYLHSKDHTNPYFRGGVFNSAFETAA